MTQAMYGVKTSLSINVDGGYVIATVVFENNSGQSFYLYKKQIPTPDGKLCDERFYITTGNIKLDYLGGWCNYGSTFNEQDWIEVPTGEKYSYSVLLNQFYEFMPEMKNYSIGGLEQFIINHEWIVKYHIRNFMRSILTSYDSCKHDYNFNYANNIESTKTYNEISILDYLSNLGLYDEKPHGIIRTNEVLIDIDGGKIKGFYSK